MTDKKKDPKITQDGAVELDETQLDQASGGILIGLNQAYKLDQQLSGVNLTTKLADGSVKPIADGTSNTIFKY